jgi:phosphatidylinositol alpha-mannosyltransferase
MKIGLVCPYNMFERTGGVQKLVEDLHEYLGKRGHEVKIITPRPSGYKGGVPDDYILLGTTRNFRGGFGVAGNWSMPIDGDEIEAVLDREKFDVLHFHEPWAPVYGRSILGYSKTAHVGTFHANLVDTVAAKSWPRLFEPVARNIAKKLHVFTAVSPAPAAIFDKIGDEYDKQITGDIIFIPNAIDLHFFKPFKKKQPLNGPDTKTVVYVGRLDRRKGIHYLLHAFDLLQRQLPQTYMIIAGEGDYRSNLEDIIRDEKIQNVKLIGHITDEEKRRLLGNADLVCAPAINGESFGIILLEAMAMGAPLLAGNNIGYTNVMTGHGRLGLIDPKATTDFANRMAVFLTDDAVRTMMSAWGLSDVKQYEINRIVNMYEEAYRLAIERWRVQRHLNGDSKHAKFWQVKRRLALRRQSRH